MHERLEVAATVDDLLDRSAMLRITVQRSPTLVSLKLEGNLAGAWVTELEECWRSANSSLDGSSLCLDLSAVEQVDRAGRYLLALMRRNGAQLIASGAVMTELVRSLAGDWPLTEE
jgi:ABC-type transporter Mla MlaB component